MSLADDYDALGDELNPPVIANGTYLAEVTKAEARVTGGGKNALALTLTVLDGPNAGTNVPDQMTWSPESPVARRIFSQSLARLGASKEWITTTRPTWEEIAQQIYGAQVEISTTIKEFNGEDRANVSYKKLVHNPNGGGAASQVPTLGAVQPQAQAPAAQPAQPAQPAAQAPVPTGAAGSGFQWPTA